MARGRLSAAGPLLLLAPPTWTGRAAGGAGAAAGSTLMPGPEPWIENSFGYSFKNETVLPAFEGPYVSAVSVNPLIPRKIRATLASVNPTVGIISFKFLA